MAMETGGVTLLLASLAAVLLSASIVGPWLTGALGKLFAAVWRRPAMLFAGRRLQSDPRAAYRSVSGIVLAVFVGSMAMTMLPSFESFAGGGRSFKDSVLYLDVPAAHAAVQQKRMSDELTRNGANAAVARAERVTLGSPDVETFPGLVISCPDAAAVTRMAVGVCAGPPAIRADPATRIPTSGMQVQPYSMGGSDAEPPKLGLPDGVVRRPLGSQEPELGDSVLIDPALVPELANLGESTLAVNPATDADREKVRTALAVSLPGNSFESRELWLGERQMILGDLKRVTGIGLALAALLAGSSAAITAASSVVDRRRTFGALIAAGAPVRMVDRALRTEAAALPALVATMGAGAGGIGIGVGMLTLVGEKATVVINGWIFAPVVIGVAGAVLAAFSSGPMLRRISTEPITDE
ncbi:hypothetical protein [Saccharopolyspora phatthalungensis]|uniref:hypothetical protein n=1 Tax=Saccharopolyspora phatthalungensis TaxID=664693 RepID=UPI001FE75FEA|nr:hypothetical protein [Saccharopolyspora phatthalungensis]